MTKVRRLILLTAFAILLLGTSTSLDTTACGEEMSLQGGKDWDLGPVRCVDGLGDCPGRFAY